MEDFKLGNKVRVNAALANVKVGSILTVVATPEPEPGYFLSTSAVNIEWANSHKQHFTLVEREFDFKADPWYIHIQSKEQYDAVKDWLAKQHKVTSLPVEWRHNGVYFTNIYLDGDKPTANRLLWSATKNGISDKAREIRLQFQTKTEVVQVTYPTIAVVKEETESQRLLKELQQQIAELQAKANQLEQEVKN